MTIVVFMDPSQEETNENSILKQTLGSDPEEVHDVAEAVCGMCHGSGCAMISQTFFFWKNKLFVSHCSVVWYYSCTRFCGAACFQLPAESSMSNAVHSHPTSASY